MYKYRNVKTGALVWAPSPIYGGDLVLETELKPIETKPTFKPTFKPTPEPTPEPEPDWDSWKVSELKEFADSQLIEYPKDVRKADLIKLITAEV